MQNLAQQDQYEDKLLEDELLNINKQEKNINVKWGDKFTSQSLFSENKMSQNQKNKYSDPNRHRFNHYADKQLYHLVVSQQFDFAKIAEILNYIYREERIKYSESSCRERWQELYHLRNHVQEVKLQRMEDKRATSISMFSDPFSQYNLEERLEKAQIDQRSKESVVQESSSNATVTGYNIFKNSIREIDNMEQYKLRQQQMISALNEAKNPTKIITDKLMHFSPYYDRLNEFQVIQEELTQQKMRQIMSIPIEMESLEYELKVKDMNESNQGEWKKKSKREIHKNLQEEHKYNLEEDWNEYESD